MHLFPISFLFLCFFWREEAASYIKKKTSVVFFLHNQDSGFCFLFYLIKHFPLLNHLIMKLQNLLSHHLLITIYKFNSSVLILSSALIMLYKIIQHRCSLVLAKSFCDLMCTIQATTILVTAELHFGLQYICAYTPDNLNYGQYYHVNIYK